MTTYADIVESITTGTVDDDLDNIREAVRLRRKELQAQEASINALTIKPGTRVRLKGLGPKYLNGLEGEVVEDPLTRSGRGKSRFAVRLDKPERAGRYGYGGTVNPPTNSVEVIDGR